MFVSSRRLTFSNWLQDGPSWLIVDSNETPGGLASTDVTDEGFVRVSEQREATRALMME
jgi:hypothetical protein